jgi:probable LLM family oxidoreductase
MAGFESTLRDSRNRMRSADGSPNGLSTMQLGVDSFIASNDDDSDQRHHAIAMREFIERIVRADEVGLDIFGVGEHHRRGYLDSAPAVVLGAAAARTRNIRLTSAVTVLSAIDPVRAFESFATIDLISNGRAEMVVGRGSFTEAFPLFGLDLGDYDALFAENLDLLLKLRDEPNVHWTGKRRPSLHGEGVFPRPVQLKLPIWLGVGGTPASFARAGTLGLPLMVAVIGGETRRFRPLVDVYREAGRRAGYAPGSLKVGLHSFGYVAATSQIAANEFFPGYARSMAHVAKERGWPPPSRRDFDAQNGPTGAFLIGSPQEVAEKILRHSEALGGISRFTFQMDLSELPHAKLMNAIELIGTKVAPAVRTALAATGTTTNGNAQNHRR